MANTSQSLPRAIPTHLTHLIGLNIEFKILVCLGNHCCKAVSGPGIVKHLRNYHKVQPEIRKQVKQYIEQSPFKYDHSTIQLPIDGLAPQPWIPVVSGIQCKRCSFRTPNRKSMKVHGNREHSLKRVRDEELFKEVQLQTWYRDGKERYWVVDESKQPGQPEGQSGIIQPSESHSNLGNSQGNGHDTDADQSESDNQEEIDDQIARDMRQKVLERKQRRITLLASVPVTENSPWHRFTEWNEVLRKSKHNLVKTHLFTRLPDVEEVELVRLLVSWSRVLERCLDTLKANDHKDTLKLWASPVNNDAAQQRPFELPQNSNTVTKYSAHWQRFICYAMRTMPASWGEETETGVEYTEPQWRISNELKKMLYSDESEAEEDSEQDQALDNMLMGFCIIILTQDMSNRTRYQSPLMHFLAIMGINPMSPTEAGLHRSLAYTPILAGVLWINRLLMLEFAVPEEPWPMLTAREDQEDIKGRLKEVRSQHLCEGSFSPTSVILSQLAKGKHLNKMEKSESNIHWSEDGETIFFKGEPVKLSKITRMGEGLVKKLHALLDWLLFEKDVPEIDLSKIIDSMAWSQDFRRDDFNFVKHKANKELLGMGGNKEGYELLLGRARKATGDRKIIGASASAGGEKQWLDHRVQAYLGYERQFLKTLMVAFHTTYGQPARGPELGSVKVSNSIYSSRNLIMINGRLGILTTYDKAQKRRMNTEFIIRFLPDELSQIYAQYVVHVRPFARVLDNRDSEYLFADLQGPWAGEQLTRELREVTKRTLGVALTVSAWRHVAIGIAIRKLTGASKTWDIKTEDDQEDNFAEGDNDDELEESTYQHILVRQASHGTRVAQNHYAIDGAFLHRLGPELISMYERASVAWHNLFRLKSDGANQARLQHKREASQQITPIYRSQPVKLEDSKTAISCKAIKGLQKIYPGGKPQSEGQEAALQLVHQPPRVCVIVLPTSSGKSVLFFSVAAMVEQQTVIVVVPFAALVDDVVRRGEDAGLQCEEWIGPQSGVELQQLIIVSADRAVSGEFLHYAKGLELSRQLAHIFFDECHVAFTDTSYRTRLRELWKLRYLNAPLTCLTATLMISLELTLQERLLIEGCMIFRRSTARPTIRYSVLESGEQPASVFGTEFVQGLQLPTGKRGVIYVRSYGTGERISEELGCSFYKATADDKSELLKRWSKEEGGWIVATGALGTGVNIPDIVYVVHIERPYGLTSFAQQSGRGGRGGEVSDSIIIVRSKINSQGRHRKEVLSAYSVEDIDEEAMSQFIQATSCRRIVLAGYLDRISEQAVDCHSTDSVLCDYCKVKSQRQWHQQQEEQVGQVQSSEGEKGGDYISKEEDEDGSNAISKRFAVEGNIKEGVFHVLQYLKGQCVYCEMMDMNNGAGLEVHGYDECIGAEANGCSMAEFSRWRLGLKFGEEYGHCYECGLSQQVCRRLEVVAEAGECEYLNIMLPVIFILDHMSELEVIVRQVGFQGDYGKDIWEWIQGAAEGFGDVMESQWTRTWEEICRRYWIMKWEAP